MTDDSRDRLADEYTYWACWDELAALEDDSAFWIEEDDDDGS